jgi:hypothetical protein
VIVNQFDSIDPATVAHRARSDDLCVPTAEFVYLELELRNDVLQLHVFGRQCLKKIQGEK